MTSRKAILLIVALWFHATLWFHAVATLGYFGFSRASELFVCGPLVAIGILARYLCLDPVGTGGRQPPDGEFPSMSMLLSEG